MEGRGNIISRNPKFFLESLVLFSETLQFLMNIFFRHFPFVILSSAKQSLNGTVQIMPTQLKY